jgi:hypothetical protein
MIVDSPWIRIPTSVPGYPNPNARAFRAYRILIKEGILRCDSELTGCAVGSRGKDLVHQGALGIKVTLGLLVADDVSVVRLLDRNSATATVTLRFLPTSVFRRFRAELAAILEAQGEALATEQIGGDNLAAAQFRRSNGSWHLEQIEPLGR